jgi:hypothetical protein
MMGAETTEIQLIGSSSMLVRVCRTMAVAPMIPPTAAPVTTELFTAYGSSELV